MNPSGAKRGVTPAGLTWDQGTPASLRFGDVYYSRGEGLAEKRHVFLAGCGLPGAWRGLEAFTICELGFGSGLSFLATVRLWVETAAPHARLNYLAVEAHPLTPDELQRSLAPWTELAREADALLGIYPAPSPGFHRLHLGGGISLTLLYGDAAAMLSQTRARVDAWYLDGFAPSRNPEMWSVNVFQEMARLSRPGAHLATYSAAGQVRRGLQDAGFTVELAAGFGRKRDMVRARYTGGARTAPAPWFAPAAPSARGRAAIVGGGIAGTAVAAALARRGWACTLVERRATLAGAASGTPAAVAMPRLTAGHAIDGRIHAAAWRYAARSWNDRTFYTPCGVLQLATDAAEAERLGLIADSGPLPALEFLSRDAASTAAGCALPVPALLFPNGGRIDARALCAAEARGADVLLGRDAAALERTGSGWRLSDNGGAICDADVVVLANAGAARAFSRSAWLPLAARHGQITAAAPSLESAKLRCVLAYGGTLTPARDGLHHVGATFSAPAPGAAEDAVSGADDARNLAQLAQVLPGLARGLTPSASWAGVRWTTSDHLPLVGPLADAAAFARDYAPLRHGQHWVDYPPAAYEPGLYVMAGFGSHGLALAPLCAELLASHVTGEPWPLEQDLVAALHPSRFLLRDLKRPK
ncbi:MAG: bifunctional tRNA (5-methylaminomethyl-2-thiouridine)(34)-methyltransferase MnmD/FAD-dependent 5-carboxymethylaminomethyl-2-thiouridine(34) oxidoreductase MnmC [Rhodospirillaceae bacterium]|nr:bifunctional tRNA (5-methylaminomethyl-2-thiouridine)(34)-methyltransferase MnmD/FAD-dependent 5-carboxymethylaminomethyl-2-thiouridine(34) oxidoreductase MnmC [Rhodospirillaceae bacterium]